MYEEKPDKLEIGQLVFVEDVYHTYEGCLGIVMTEESYWGIYEVYIPEHTTTARLTRGQLERLTDD